MTEENTFAESADEAERVAEEQLRGLTLDTLRERALVNLVEFATGLRGDLARTLGEGDARVGTIDSLISGIDKATEEVRALTASEESATVRHTKFVDRARELLFLVGRLEEHVGFVASAFPIEEENGDRQTIQEVVADLLDDTRIVREVLGDWWQDLWVDPAPPGHNAG